MKKKLLTLFFIPFLLLGCNNGNPSTSATSTSGGGSESSRDPAGNEYDKWCNSWSKAGHCYFHYNRGADKNDYDNFCFWIWQFAPQNLEGSLWAYSGKDQVSEKLTLKPMSRQWMTAAEVGKTGSDPYYKDEFGVIVDVDLYKTGLVGGKTGKTTTFEGAQSVGFLFPKQDSMDGKSNWTSDGGKETYVDEFGDAENWRAVEGGSCIHVFVSSGALGEYVFYQGDGAPEVKINPMNQDHTGKWSSAKTTIADKYGNSSTSGLFKQTGFDTDLGGAGVGYQIFVASFRDSNGDGLGDIRGIIDSLDYLDDLGVDVLWLTPIQKSDSYHGYDISDYYQVDSKFGTLDDYRELIYKAHQRKMKVLMDLVLNHTSKNNVWYTKSQWGVNSGASGAESDLTGINWRNIYTWKFKDDNIKVRHRELVGDQYVFDGTFDTITVGADSVSDGPSWYKDGESDYYYYGKFGSGMPELNYDNQQTRDLVIDMAKYWLSFGLDGYRLDAVKHIYMEDESNTDSGDKVIIDVGTKESYDDEKGKYVKKPYDYSSNITKNVAWWKNFSNELKAVYPNCFLVGENFDGWGTRTSTYYQALDSQFDFSNYYHIPSMIYGPSTASGFANKQASETYDTFAGNGPYDVGPDASTHVYIDGGKRGDFINGAFTSNHDVMRCINHVNYTAIDATGNTTDNQAIDGSVDQVNKARIAGAISVLNPGLSWIYYGDELGMSSNPYSASQSKSHKDLYGSENSMDIWYRQPFLWSDTSVRTNYKSGQYLFELDNYNTSLSNAGKGITYEKQAGAEKYTVVTTNETYKFYKEINKIKRAYPYDSKVTYSSYSSNNVLVMDVTGNGKAMKIFINTGINNDNYLMNVPGYKFYNAAGWDFNPSGSDWNIGSHKFSVVAFQQE